ncbi:hypothetical protein K438DRAFT_1756112 [Mycena galopus ATCC 62051]|nr:hypothetical protein K438DRAFT_1756112 [Mycena galopus ATCC 62051]
MGSFTNKDVEIGKKLPSYGEPVGMAGGVASHSYTPVPRALNSPPASSSPSSSSSSSNGAAKTPSGTRPPEIFANIGYIGPKTSLREWNLWRCEGAPVFRRGVAWRGVACRSGSAGVSRRASVGFFEGVRVSWHPRSSFKETELNDTDSFSEDTKIFQHPLVGHMPQETLEENRGRDIQTPLYCQVEGLALTVDGKKAKERLSKFSITIEISNGDTSACAPDLRKWEGEYANIMNQHGTARYCTVLHGTARHRCTVACTAVAYRALPWRTVHCRGVNRAMACTTVLVQDLF